MKRGLMIAIAAVMVIGLIGCGAFKPAPSISSFTATQTSINAGQTVTFTVQGTTVSDMGEASTTDYSGTVYLTCSDLSYNESATFDRDADENFSVTINSAGTYTFTAELEASDGTSVTDTITVTVAASNPWSGATVTDLSFEDWVRGSLSTSSDVDWYRKSTGSSTYYVHYFDDVTSSLSTVANIELTVYGDDGTILDQNEYNSPSSAISTSGYDYVYIKVESYDSSTGGYYLTISSSSSVPTEGTITQNGGNPNCYLSSGEIEVWSFSPSSSGSYQVQWADSYRNIVSASGSLTVDVEVSGWNGDSDPLFWRDDDLTNADDQTHSLSSWNTLYVIVEDSAGSSGYYYVDVD